MKIIISFTLNILKYEIIYLFSAKILNAEENSNDFNTQLWIRGMSANKLIHKY